MLKDTLKKLSAALKALETHGLDKSDVLRLRGIITGCKVYKELFADYIDYRGLEAELLDGREGKICGACEKVPDDSAQINCLMSVSGFVKMWLVLKKWLQGRDSNPNLLVKNHFWSHYEYVFTKQSEFKAQRPYYQLRTYWAEKLCTTRSPFDQRIQLLRSRGNLEHASENKIPGWVPQMED